MVRPLFLSLFILLSLCGAQQALALPEAEQADNVESTLPVDQFSKALGNHVTDGTVTYAGFDMNEGFDAFINQIETIDLDGFASPEQRLAFYINAYNALAIKGILKGRSPKTLLGKVKYFYTSNYKVGGRKINLYDLEHKRIRPLGEPRIHFALVCAALSCPKLRSEAYTPDQLNRQLDENARDFINDSFKNRFDKEKKVAYLSKIFDWFEEDFTAKGDTLQSYIARYVADPEVAKDLAANRYKVKHMKYHWTLNGKR